MLTSDPCVVKMKSGNARKRNRRSNSLHIAIITTISFAFVNITVSLLDLKDNTFDSLLQIYKCIATNKDTVKPNSNVDFYHSIDIISIGTILKPELQQAQYETFGSHPTIRNYYRITELNDTDRTCSTNLTEKQFYTVQNFCNNKDAKREYTGKIVTLLHQDSGKSSFRARNVGWLCAQKRPLDGLYNVLHPYQSSTSITAAKNPNSDFTIPLLDGTNTRSIPSKQDLPKYIIIVDDDTYLNMTYTVDMLHQHYRNYDEPHILAGCLLRFNQKVIYRFPFGGYGTIITRQVMEKLIRPIYCNGNGQPGASIFRLHNINDLWNEIVQRGFQRSVCRQLQQNLIGELTYFRDGMSVLDLMQKFSSSLLFTKVNDWVNGTGYCFHSDHALAYFFGYYSIGVTDSMFYYYNPFTFQTVRYKRRRGYGYNLFAENEVSSTCSNVNCDGGNSTTICHYMNPERMHELYEASLYGSVPGFLGN